MTKSLDFLIEETLRGRPDVAEELRAIQSREVLRESLLYLRKELGLTQAEVGIKVGWKQPYVARLERAAGISPDSIPVGTLARYAQACSTKLVLVFVDEDNNKAKIAYDCSENIVRFAKNEDIVERKFLYRV